MRVILIPYSIDEVLATVQYLWRAKKAGEPFWRTFWRGGPALSEDPTLDADLDRPAWEALKDFVFGGDLPLVTWRKHSARRPADGDAARP